MTLRVPISLWPGEVGCSGEDLLIDSKKLIALDMFPQFTATCQRHWIILSVHSYTLAATDNYFGSQIYATGPG